METEPEMLAAMEELFMQTDSIVLAAIKVGKLHHSGDSTGAQLLKALGAKQTYDQDSMQPRLLVFTVKRSMTDRGFKASMHICKPSQSAVGFQIRKSYSLKYLEYMKVLSQKYEHREQRFIEMRIGTHHNVSETRAEFALESSDSLFLTMSVIVQLLRWVLHVVAGTFSEASEAGPAVGGSICAGSILQHPLCAECHAVMHHHILHSLQPCHPIIRGATTLHKRITVHHA
jgi:hypothetical protein